MGSRAEEPLKDLLQHHMERRRALLGKVDVPNTSPQDDDLSMLNMLLADMFDFTLQLTNTLVFPHPQHADDNDFADNIVLKRCTDVMNGVYVLREQLQKDPAE